MRLGPFSMMLASALVLGTPVVEAAQPSDGSARWRDVATQADRSRIRNWRRAWLEALDAALHDGHATRIAQEGALLHPDAALERPTPPPGLYRCRTTKLGAQGSMPLTYIAYPAFRCRVDSVGDVTTFTKLTGSQRPVGRLYPDNIRRMVFLGTMQLGDEHGWLRYGQDGERDLAGVVERIGEQRWRLVFPRPAFESILDVIELVPAA